MRVAYVVAALLLIASGVKVYADEAPATMDGMPRVQSSRAALAYVRPGTDWSKYRNIQLGTLQIPPKVRDGAPRGTRPEFGESYILRDKDVAALQQEYDKAMRSKLSEAGFTFVTTPGPDTLIIAGQVLNIRLAAPIESTRRGFTGSGMTFSQGAGTMTIALAFADGPTGHVIAEVADHYMPAQIWGINNSVANRAQAIQGFNKWAGEVRDALRERRTVTQ